MFLKVKNKTTNCTAICNYKSVDTFKTTHYNNLFVTLSCQIAAIPPLSVHHRVAQTSTNTHTHSSKYKIESQDWPFDVLKVYNVTGENRLCDAGTYSILAINVCNAICPRDLNASRKPNLRHRKDEVVSEAGFSVGEECRL